MVFENSKPISIVYVMKGEEDFHDEILEYVNKYCLENHIPFTTRLFNSYMYSMDRKYITKLPAIHAISKSRRYMGTFYPDSAIEMIQHYIRMSNKSKWPSLRSIFGLRARPPMAAIEVNPMNV
jgi:hypothetical protein